MRTRARRTAETGLMRLEVDGVPVFYRSVAGPLRAALTFRVGVADEQLHERGLTHLIEHLALTVAPDSVHAFNGCTGTLFTQFVVAGDEEDVVEFLHLVCGGLREPHLDRLAHEQGVLKAEASTRTGFVGDDQLIWRFGPKSIAGSAYDEWGVSSADDQTVNAWISRYFHSGNCALWLSGPPPNSLRLDMPRGVGPAPVPDGLVTPVISLPSVYGRGRPDSSVSWVLSDKRGTSALGWLVSERMTAALRHEAGLSYGCRFTMERVDQEHVWQMINIDATGETADAVQQGVVKVLLDVRDRPATAAEVKKLRTQWQLASQDPSGGVAHLDYWVRETLLGNTPVTQEEATQRWTALSPADITAHVPDALASLLMGTPFPEEVPAELAAPAPAWSSIRHKGTMVLPMKDLDPTEVGVLFLASDGLSLVRDDDRVISVGVADCAAVFRWDDGSVQVYGNDGCTIFVAIEDWIGSHEVEKWAKNLPPSLVHPAGSRIQRQRSSAPPSSPASTARRSWRMKWGTATTIAAIFFSAQLIRLAVSDDSPSADKITSSRLALPTSLRPFDCFNGVGTVVPCTQPHRYQVLPGSGQPSFDDAVDTAYCASNWSHFLSTSPTFQVTVQLQDDAGTPTRLCVASRKDGKPSVGGVVAAAG